MIASTKVRDWTVLFIGGPSGVGKSSIAYGLAQFYNVNVVEADDICQAIRAMTTIETHPFLHYWGTGKNWLDAGIDGNVNWLIGVSQEMILGLRAIAARHIEDDVPVIIEGDFIHPDLLASFHDPRVKALYIIESDKNQILQNFYSREGGEYQYFRADISIQYGEWLAGVCDKLGFPVIASRPWDNALERATDEIM